MAAHSGPPAPYEEPPRQRSGCLVALYVLFGIGLFGVVVGGIGIWAFLQTEEGQQIMQVAKDGAEWMVVASQAPGTEELRETGCEVALVSDAGSAMDIFTSFIPEDGKSQDLREQLAAEAGEESLDDVLMVVCTVERFSIAEPECGELARTYSSAVDFVPDSFFVLVMKQGQDQPSCQGIYAPDGTLLRQPFPLQ